MRDPSFFCLCPVFVVKPVVLMYKKVLRPFSTSSTETQVRGILRVSVLPLEQKSGFKDRCGSDNGNVGWLRCLEPPHPSAGSPFEMVLDILRDSSEP